MIWSCGYIECTEPYANGTDLEDIRVCKLGCHEEYHVKELGN